MQQKPAIQHLFNPILIGVLFFLLFTPSSLSAAKVNVTFRVDMSNAYPANGLWVGSDWGNWSFPAFEKLTDANNDSIFEVTIQLTAGASYNYRYTLSNSDWNHFESMAGLVCGAGPAKADRNIVVPQVDSVLNVVCFNACAACGSTVTTDLNLSVDMSGVVVSSNGVHVAGSFNAWSTSSLVLKDENSDGIYTISVPVVPDLTYEYKFLNGNSIDNAEVVFGTCEFRSNRRVTVNGDPVNMPVVKFGSCNSTGAPITDIKIACIGNSITEGGADNYSKSWPIQLRDLLGSGYYTENLGVSGTTMNKTGDSPWWNQPQLNYTIKLNPDVIFIKLGTNDSKSFNWNADKFKSAYTDMINLFRGFPSHPMIYMVTPAKAYSSAYSISDNTIRTKIIPVLNQIAFEKGVQLVDMYAATSDMSNVFPDGIHPNSTGAGVIAQKAKENLLKTKPVVSQVEKATEITANNLYQWFYNDAPLAGSNSQTINVSAEGKYQVLVKMSAGSNDIYISDVFNMILPPGTDMVGLTTDYTVITNLNPKVGSGNLLMYPNPAVNTLNIENAINSDVTVLNDLGKVVLTQKGISMHQNMDISSLKNGIYIVKVTENESTIVRKLVINKK